MPVYSVDKLMAQTRRLAVEYRSATGKPLPVGSELANYDAARLLDLELVPPGAAGYDAIGRGVRAGQRIQIKGRTIFDGQRSGQRIGQLKVNQDWDSLMLVLLDEDFEPFEIYEADRETVEDALADSASPGQRKRGAISVAKFKIIGRLAWSRSGDEARSGAAIARDR